MQRSISVVTAACICLAVWTAAVAAYTLLVWPRLPCNSAWGGGTPPPTCAWALGILPAASAALAGAVFVYVGRRAALATPVLVGLVAVAVGCLTMMLVGGVMELAMIE